MCGQHELALRLIQDLLVNLSSRCWPRSPREIVFFRNSAKFQKKNLQNWAIGDRPGKFGWEFQTFGLPMSPVLWALLYFSDRNIGHISRTKKRKKKKPGFPFFGWLMINIASKNHTQTRKIERGMANLRLWQLLGWPSLFALAASQRSFW